MKKLIVAGNYQEFLKECKKLNLVPGVEAKNICNVEDLKGARITHNNIIYTGTFFKRKNIDEIYEMLENKYKRHSIYKEKKQKKSVNSFNLFFAIIGLSLIILGFVGLIISITKM